MNNDFSLDDDSSLSSGTDVASPYSMLSCLNTQNYSSDWESTYFRNGGSDTFSESTNTTPSPPRDHLPNNYLDSLSASIPPETDVFQTAFDTNLVVHDVSIPDPLMIDLSPMSPTPISSADPAPLLSAQHNHIINYHTASLVATAPFAPVATPPPPPPPPEQSETSVSQIRPPRKRRREESAADYVSEMSAVKKEISERTGKMTEEEEKELKKKKRMLKNRISAQQSRDKRRQQLVDYEQQVNHLSVHQTEMQNKINRLESENTRLLAENARLLAENSQMRLRNNQFPPSHNIQVMYEEASLSLKTEITPTTAETVETTHTSRKSSNRVAQVVGLTAFVIFFACVFMVRLGEQPNNGYGAASDSLVSLPHLHEGGKIFKNTAESILSTTAQDASQQFNMTLLQQRVLYPPEMEQSLYGLSRSYDKSPSATSTTAASPISIASKIVHAPDSSQLAPILRSEAQSSESSPTDISVSESTIDNNHLLPPSESSNEIYVSDGEQDDVVDDILIGSENSINTISPVVNAVLLSHDERYRYRTLSIGNNQSTSSRQDAQWHEALLFSLAPNNTKENSADDTMFLVCSDVHPMMTHNARKNPSKIRTITVLLSLGEASHISGVPMLEYFKGPGALLAQLPTVPITDTKYAFVSAGSPNASSRSAASDPTPTFQ